MKAFTASWSEITDQTDVTFTPDFNAQHDVTKFDILNDVIFMLICERDKLNQQNRKEVTAND
jgi:hypothetical protein